MGPFILCNITILWGFGIKTVLESIFRSIRSQIFLKIDALKYFCSFYRKTPVMESVAALNTCKVIEKKFYHRCFSVKITNFLGTSISLQSTSSGCFWVLLRGETNYIYTLVLKVLRFDLIRRLESRQKIENKKKLGTLEMYMYCLKE